LVRASTAAGARTNLGVAIGNNVQAWDADLDCFASLSGTGLLRRTGSGTCSNGTTTIVAEGGTGQITLLNHGILLGQGTAGIVAAAVMTDGQLLVGQSVADPLPKTITGDVTFTAAGVTAIGTAKVTLAMMADATALSVLGRAANSSGVPAYIAAGSDFQIMRRSGVAIAFGAIDLSQANAVGSSLLALANGGCNAALTASNGGILYSTASA
jgi:hypothetical protein